MYGGVPAVYICECVGLCTEIVRDEDPFWKVLTVLVAGEKSGEDACGATIGTVMSGLLCGMPLGRVVAGSVGDHYGWRAVYWLGCCR
jgi:MFS family permease